ncbi:MAG: AbrB family transcriptional regulator, partial [Natronospirillum sp.]
SGIAVVSGQVLALPWVALNGAQFLLGLALGVMFRREFVTRAPAFMRAAAIMVGVMIILAAGFAYLVSLVTDHGFGSLMLSFAPAGITEMMLTAKALGFEAPLITAIHLTRIILIVVLTAGLFRLFFRPGRS